MSAPVRTAQQNLHVQNRGRRRHDIGALLFARAAEGPDDMPARARSALTATLMLIPVIDGRHDLGTWQGISLWEHRLRPHASQLTVAVVGA